MHQPLEVYFFSDVKEKHFDIFEGTQREYEVIKDMCLVGSLRDVQYCSFHHVIRLNSLKELYDGLQKLVDEATQRSNIIVVEACLENGNLYKLNIDALLKDLYPN
jgi:hypothetical protein